MNSTELEIAIDTVADVTKLSTWRLKIWNLVATLVTKFPLQIND